MLRVNLAVTCAMLGSIVTGIVTATLGYQAIIARLDRFEAAIYGSAADATEPGLRADMRSVDRRLNALAGTVAGTDAKLTALKDRFEYSAYRGGGTPHK